MDEGPLSRSRLRHNNVRIAGEELPGAAGNAHALEARRARIGGIFRHTDWRADRRRSILNRIAGQTVAAGRLPGGQRARRIPGSRTAGQAREFRLVFSHPASLSTQAKRGLVNARRLRQVEVSTPAATKQSHDPDGTPHVHRAMTARQLLGCYRQPEIPAGNPAVAARTWASGQPGDAGHARAHDE